MEVTRSTSTRTQIASKRTPLMTLLSVSLVSNMYSVVFAAASGSHDYFDHTDTYHETADVIPAGLAIKYARADEEPMVESKLPKITNTDDSAQTDISWFSLILYETPIVLNEDSMELVKNVTTDVLDYEFAELFMNFRKFRLTVEESEAVTRLTENDDQDDSLGATNYSGRALGYRSQQYSHNAMSRDDRSDTFHQRVNRILSGTETGTSVTLGGASLFFTQPVESRNKCDRTIYEAINSPRVNKKLIQALKDTNDVALANINDIQAVPYKSTPPTQAPTPGLTESPSLSPTMTFSEVPTEVATNSSSQSVFVPVVNIAKEVEDNNVESDTVIYTSIILGAAFVLVVGLFLRRRRREGDKEDNSLSDLEAIGDMNAAGERNIQVGEVDLRQADVDWVKNHTFREEDGRVVPVNRDFELGSQQKYNESYSSSVLIGQDASHYFSESTLSPTSGSTFSATSDSTSTITYHTQNEFRKDNTLLTAATVTKFLKPKVTTPLTRGSDHNIEIIYGSSSGKSKHETTGEVSDKELNDEWGEKISYDWGPVRDGRDSGIVGSAAFVSPRANSNGNRESESSTITDSQYTGDQFIGAFPSFTQQKKASKIGPKTPSTMFGKPVESSHSSSDMHPLDWSNKSDFDRTSVGSSTGENGSKAMKRNPRQMITSPIGSVVSMDSGASSKDSRQLINDLVWLEERIAQVRGGSPSQTTDSNQEDTVNPIMESIICRDCYAPPGKLNITIRSTVDGPAVHSVSENSSLLGQMSPGDLIIAVDDIDTRKLSADQVLDMILSRNDFERKITVLHFDSSNADS